MQLTHFVNVIGEPVIVRLNKIIKIMITGELVIVCLLASHFNRLHLHVLFFLIPRQFGFVSQVGPAFV